MGNSAVQQRVWVETACWSGTGQCGLQRLEKDHREIIWKLLAEAALRYGQNGTRGNKMAGWLATLIYLSFAGTSCTALPEQS